jgi:hypothetical protein
MNSRLKSDNEYFHDAEGDAGGGGGGGELSFFIKRGSWRRPGQDKLMTNLESKSESLEIDCQIVT